MLGGERGRWGLGGSVQRRSVWHALPPTRRLRAEGDRRRARRRSAAAHAAPLLPDELRAGGAGHCPATGPSAAGAGGGRENRGVEDRVGGELAVHVELAGVGQREEVALVQVFRERALRLHQVLHLRRKPPPRSGAADGSRWPAAAEVQNQRPYLAGEAAEDVGLLQGAVAADADVGRGAEGPRLRPLADEDDLGAVRGVRLPQILRSPAMVNSSRRGRTTPEELGRTRELQPKMGGSPGRIRSR